MERVVQFLFCFRNVYREMLDDEEYEGQKYVGNSFGNEMKKTE